MRFLLSLLLLSSLALAGCSGFRDSRANPVNWFGKKRSGTVIQAPTQPEEQEYNPLIHGDKNTRRGRRNASTAPKPGLFSRRNKIEVYNGTPVDQVSALTFEKTSAGAIIRATGISLRQGAYDARLVSDTKGKPVDGVLTYKLKAVQPTDLRQGPQSTRTFQVGQFVSNEALEQTKVIRVIAERNELTRRR